MIQGIKNLFTSSNMTPSLPKEVQAHLDRAQYFLGFVFREEKKYPGLIGMISFEEQIKGLSTEKFFFENALLRKDFGVDVKLAISKMLNKVDHALDKLQG